MNSIPILPWEELSSLVDEIVCKVTQKSLTNVQVTALKGAYEGKQYKHMTGMGFQPATLRDAAAGLWKILSKELGVKVTKTNFMQVLVQYQYKEKKEQDKKKQASQPETTPTSRSEAKNSDPSTEQGLLHDDFIDNRRSPGGDLHSIAAASPCYTTDPPTHGSHIFSDDPLMGDVDVTQTPGSEQQSTDNKQTIFFILFNILDSKKDNLEVINAVKEAFSKVIPPDWLVLWRETPTEFHDIIKQLEDIPHLNDNDSPILKFINFLLALNIPQTIREELEQVLTNKPKVNETKVKSTPTQPLRSYLQIQLGSKRIQELSVKACFILDDTIKDPSERFKPLTLDEQQAEIPFVLEEWPLVLSNLIQQCHKRYIKRQTPELTIEIFLPEECLFNQRVEKWLYQDEHGFPITLGERYAVVVRSSERVEKINTTTGYNWREKWGQVQQIWNVDCNEQVVTVAQGDIDGDKLPKLHKQLLLTKKNILVVNCSLSDLEQKNLYRLIHSVGTPIVIWSRCDVKDFSNPEDFNALVREIPDKWTERVTQQRRASALDASDKKHSGNTIFFMVDNPNRIPPRTRLEFPE